MCQWRVWQSLRVPWTWALVSAGAAAWIDLQIQRYIFTSDICSLRVQTPGAASDGSVQTCETHRLPVRLLWRRWIIYLALTHRYNSGRSLSRNMGGNQFCRMPDPPLLQSGTPLFSYFALWSTIPQMASILPNVKQN